MKNLFRGNFIYMIVLLISILLIGQILLTKHNNKILIENKERQIEIQKIDNYYDQIGKLVIHALDIGLRGYVVIQSDKFAKPMFNARSMKDSILNNAEEPLIKLKYNISEFKLLRDSVDAYVEYIFNLKRLLDEGNQEEFLQIFQSDRGARLWGQYVDLERRISHFQDQLYLSAESRYNAALNRNIFLQFMIFFIAFPTLLYTAYYANKVFRLLELLRTTEEEKNVILTHQNADLERLVADRTKEILAQNEEISAQSEEIIVQRNILADKNEKLQEAQILIEAQNAEIQTKNEHLELEVKHRTEELENANKQLIEHNHQLEQFSFITAHNLRSPLARILGLAKVMEFAASPEEKEYYIHLLVSSTQDLDNVIKDLNVILEIRKNTGNVVKVNVKVLLDRVIKVLNKEIEETQATIQADLRIDTIEGIAPYVESILYNLISNAIKYRHPDRPPVISISTTQEENYMLLSVSDNGLGIDLTKYRNNLFSLYKRFHLHMEGKGLGLYLVRAQIMALGGKVDVESEPDKGATFKVYFKSN